MATTITTTTTTIVTSAAGATLVVIAIITLIALLVQKELVSGLSGVRARRLSQALNVSLIPLTVIFLATVAVRIGALLS